MENPEIQQLQQDIDNIQQSIINLDSDNSIKGDQKIENRKHLQNTLIRLNNKLDTVRANEIEVNDPELVAV
jgi:hypothetical protein